MIYKTPTITLLSIGTVLSWLDSQLVSVDYPHSRQSLEPNIFRYHQTPTYNISVAHYLENDLMRFKSISPTRHEVPILIKAIIDCNIIGGYVTMTTNM